LKEGAVATTRSGAGKQCWECPTSDRTAGAQLELLTNHDTKGINSMPMVFLRKRIIVSDNVIFQAEREVKLPISPCVGIRLYNTEWQAPGCDESEDRIEAIAYDLKTGRTHCYLSTADFRPEKSDAVWSEDDVRALFQDWKLKRQVASKRSSKKTRAAEKR
jgi:hypothetical protein